jgi:plasmid stabilization system protein ParE
VKRLRLTPEAELDVDEAHLRYHRRAPGRATEFLAAVDFSLASIQRQPEAYALVDPTMRRALLRRFPYAVFYERSWCTASSMVQGILARGNAEGTDNFAVEQTAARIRSLAAADRGVR